MGGMGEAAMQTGNLAMVPLYVYCGSSCYLAIFRLSAMASVALRCFSVLVCLDAVIGYPTGPPTGACGRMAPKQTAASCHRALPQNSSAPVPTFRPEERRLETVTQVQRRRPCGCLYLLHGNRHFDHLCLLCSDDRSTKSSDNFQRLYVPGTQAR